MLEIPLPPPINRERKQGEPYLGIKVNTDTSAVIAMEYIQEVVVVNAKRITPLPNMPVSVLGLINQRSKVFWVVDLGKMLGMEPLSNRQEYNLVILRWRKEALGIAVEKIKGVVRVSKSSIQSPVGSFIETLTPFLQGVVIEEKQLLLVLDAPSIAGIKVLSN